MLFLGSFEAARSGLFAESKITTVRIGHFPNITHAQGVIGHARGSFEPLGPDAVVHWKIFNAGPSAIEALFAGQLDITYIGPSPAINGFIKSDGEALRIIAGAASGGAALVVRADSGIRKPEDFRNKKTATPQLGNTQDVSLRAWLAKNELRLKEVGGDVQVLPLTNADHVTLFLKKEIDASWTVEPWVSTLVQKADGKVYLDEATLWPDGRYATAVVVVRKKFLDEHPDIVRRFLKVHAELTDWITTNPDEAKAALKKEIEKETQKEFSQSILDSAFPKILFTTDLMRSSILQQAEAAYQAGYIKKKPELADLFDDTPLETGAGKSLKKVLK